MFGTILANLKFHAYRLHFESDMTCLVTGKKRGGLKLLMYIIYIYDNISTGRLKRKNDLNFFGEAYKCTHGAKTAQVAANLLSLSRDIRMRSHRLVRLDDNKSVTSC